MKTAITTATAVLFSGIAWAGNGALESNEPAPPESETLALTSPAWKTLVEGDGVTITWGGRLFNDWGFVSGDDSYDTQDGTLFRAGRIYAAGTLFDVVDFKVNYDWADTTAKSKDLWMRYQTPIGKVKVGHFKEPMSLEQLTSSRFTTFMERSLADALVPARNTGCMWADGTESSDVNWALGVFRDSGDDGADKGDGDYAITGRVHGTAWYNDEGADLLHWGLGISKREDDNGVESFKSSPENSLTGTMADTGSLAAEDTTLVNLEGAWVQGPLSVQGEYMMASVSGDGTEDSDLAGYYLTGSYLLTGETRPYKKSAGAFKGIKPKKNADADLAGGAWEVALRLSSLDLDDGAAAGGEMDGITAGVNWYLNPNARIQFNYIRSTYDDGAVDDDADILMFRFQVTW